MNNKGNSVLIILILILVGAIFTISLVNLSKRDCTKDKDCSGDAYCGSDFECHEFPEKIVVRENNWVWPALILGVALIVAAYILRSGKSKPETKAEVKEEQKNEEKPKFNFP